MLCFICPGNSQVFDFVPVVFFPLMNYLKCVKAGSLPPVAVMQSQFPYFSEFV